MYREVAAWLLPTALATDHGPTLVTAVLEELRARHIVCPPLRAIERPGGPAARRLGGSVRARAQRQLWRQLTGILPHRLWCALSSGMALSSTSPLAILETMMAAPITSSGRFSPRGPLGIATEPEEICHGDRRERNDEAKPHHKGHSAIRQRL